MKIMPRWMNSLILLFTCATCISGCYSRSPARSVNQQGKTLVELCQRYPTDKCPYHHNYVEFYEALFSPLKNQRIRLLEIGVLKGDSMKLWEAYFPEARIFGLDIYDKAEYDTERVKTLVADQGNRADLTKAIAVTGRDFDIILDDGGHRMDQQQISFGALFPALKSGGLYILEDVHTSFPELHPGYGVDPDGQNSTYAVIDGFVRAGRIHSKYLTNAENDYLNNNISRCLYFFRPNKFHSDFFACWKK